MPEFSRPYLAPLALTLWGVALLAQNFLLLPSGWRLGAFALLALSIHLLWRGDWPSNETTRAARHFRILRDEASSASLIVDSGPIDTQIMATTEKTAAGAKAASLIAGEYARATKPRAHRHFEHATVRLDRRPLSTFEWSDWKLRLAPDLPWQMEIRSWLGNLHLDCSALPIDSAEFSNVFGDLHFTPPLRAQGQIRLRNIWGDLHIHTPADRHCRTAIRSNRFTRVYADTLRYTAHSPHNFTAGSLAESEETVMLELYPGFGDVYLD